MRISQLRLPPSTSRMKRRSSASGAGAPDRTASRCRERRPAKTIPRRASNAAESGCRASSIPRTAARSRRCSSVPRSRASDRRNAESAADRRSASPRQASRPHARAGFTAGATHLEFFRERILVGIRHRLDDARGRRGRRSRTAWGPPAASRRRCRCWRRWTRCGPEISVPIRPACASRRGAAYWAASRTACRE